MSIYWHFIPIFNTHCYSELKGTLTTSTVPEMFSRWWWSPTTSAEEEMDLHVEGSHSQCRVHINVEASESSQVSLRIIGCSEVVGNHEISSSWKNRKQLRHICWLQKDARTSTQTLQLIHKACLNQEHLLEQKVKYQLLEASLWTCDEALLREKQAQLMRIGGAEKLLRTCSLNIPH